MVRPSGALAGPGVVVALAVGAFSYVTTENLPVGLLPLIAADLRVSPSAVGLLVTGYGLTVAAASVPLTRLARRIPRRTLFALLLTVFVLTSLIAAIASSYWLLLAARVGTALSQAVFWPAVAPAAANLFSPAVRGRVITLVFTGASLATIAGVPAGTWLGQQAGWRVSFLALSGLGLAALVAVVTLLPDMRPGEGHAAVGTHPDARRYRIVVVTTALTIAGVFTAYTYIAVFLTEVSDLSPGGVVTALLIHGVAGLAGLACAGALIDRRPRQTLIAAVSLLTVALVGLFLAGGSPVAAGGLLALSGFALSGVPTGTQNRLMQVAPGSTEMASAWNGAAFNVGIGGGALLGGVLLPTLGVRATALAGGLLTAASVLVLIGERFLTPLMTPDPRHSGTILK
jgi:predicted MFS family arabinose efflux permease